MASTILLIRHGENDWVKERRLAGWTPGVCLNAAGRQQAAQVGERLTALPLQAVYSSPLERCIETAQAVAEPHGLSVIPLEEVGEVRYGEWEGAFLKELAQKPEWLQVQLHPSRFQFPGGEAMRETQRRMVNCLERLAHEHPQHLIAVVSHADPIKLALAHYLGLHLDQFQRLVVAPASISVLSLSSRGGAHVLRLNDDGPLRLPPPPEAASDEKASPPEAVAASPT